MRTDGRKNVFASNMLVTLKDQNWLDKQRVAGKVVAGALSLLKNEVEKGTQFSLLELNELAETYIQDHKCSCTFKNYKGFPAGVCISVNRQLVHGIPTNYKLQEGDVVSFDLGATFEGAIGDSAITCIYGQPKSDQHVKLIAATELALMKGIQAIKVGDHLGCIGEAIYKSARAHGFSVVCNYGGHGLDWNIPHASPFVANKGPANEGIRIQPGLAIAIEPMLVIGSSAATTTGTDGWTVSTLDVGAHFEHSVFVHEDRVEIITDRVRQ
jgi:methionyl aminopeptidase